MKINEHYIRLRHANADQVIGIPFKTTISKLADQLFCSQRYVKLLLKEMHERNWIERTSGRGRGNFSTITFLLEIDELIILKAKQWIAEGRYNEAIESAQKLSNSTREQFFKWLNDQLGLKVTYSNEDSIDILRFPYYSTIKSLDPMKILSRHDTHMAEQIYDMLLVYNSKTNHLEPRIAFHWEFDQKNMIWTFFLRKGIIFHDGKILTAHDVEVSLKRLMNLPAIHEVLPKQEIVEIHPLHDTAIQIKVNRFNQLLPHYLASPRASIIPSEVGIQENEDFFRLPIGSGPFQIVHFDSSLIALEAHKQYFFGRPHLDRIEMLTIPELNQLDRPLLSYFMDQSNIDEKWEEIKQIEEGAAYVVFNENKGSVMQNRAFREVLQLLFHRQSLINDLNETDWRIPAHSFLSQRSFLESEITATPEEITSLLEKTNYKGERLSLYSTEIRPEANHRLEAEWIAAKCKDFGIEVDVQVIPTERLINPEVYKTADMIVTGLLLGEDTLFSLYKAFQLHSTFIRSMIGGSLNTFLDHLLNQFQKESKIETRFQILESIEDKLTDHRLIHFLYHRYQRAYVNQDLRGTVLSANGKVNYKDLWIRHEANTN